MPASLVIFILVLITATGSAQTPWRSVFAGQFLTSASVPVVTYPPIIWTGLGSNATTTAALNYSNTAAITIHGNTLALCAVYGSATTWAAPTNVDGTCGLSWTPINNVLYSNSTHGIALYWATTNANTPSGYVRARYAAAQTGGGIRICELTNVVLTSPIIQSVTAGAANSSPSVSLSALSWTNDCVIGFFGGSTNGVFGNAETGYTFDYNGNYLTPSVAGFLEYQTNATDTSPNLTAAAAQQWAGIGVEIAGLGYVAPPGSSYSDNFTFSDGDFLTTSDPPWTNATTADGWSIASDAVVLNAYILDQCEYYQTNWPNDQFSQVAATIVGTSAGSGVGVCVRCQTNAETYYRVVVDAGGNYEIGRVNTGTFTSLRTGTVTYSAGAPIYLSAVGTTLTFKYNGAQVGATITSSGAGSIASGCGGLAYSSAITSFSVDNWTGGTP